MACRLLTTPWSLSGRSLHLTFQGYGHVKTVTFEALSSIIQYVRIQFRGNQTILAEI